MADDKGQYKMPDQGSDAEFGKSSIKGGTENIKSILMNKRVLVLLGVIVLSILLWVFGSESSDETVEPVPPAVEPVQPVEKVIEEPQAPKVEPVANSSQTEDELKQVSDRLDSYEKQLVNVSNSLSGIDSQIYQLSSKLETLTGTVEKLIPKKKEVVTQKSLEHFYIRAIVEGRAWLRSSASNNITVSVGDKINTYGEVTGIYPNEGVVSTTSGRSIVFIANE